MGALVQLAFGLCFGVVLASTGAADFDAMERMFRFEEVHLFALAGVTTFASAAGLFLLLRSRWGDGVRARAHSVHRGNVAGGIVFGIGWGLSGTCPGTALAQLGSGYVIAGVTVVGILIGNWGFERFLAGRFGLGTDTCG